MRMTLSDAAMAMHASGVAEPTGTRVLLTGVSIDSRTVQPGDLFFCLPGARSDGHDHVPHALENGAAAVVAVRPLPVAVGRAPVLIVPDTAVALGLLAAAWRMRTAGKVVGVTGTAGKTTVKEMLAGVCSLAAGTCRNHLNWNNQIGLPVSMLLCTGQESFWVMEAGISRPGDMDELGRILTPDLAVLLNAGAAHLAELGCVAGVAAAKAKLLRHLHPEGKGLVNRDCPELWRESRLIRPEVHGFSLRDPDAEFFSRGLGKTGSNQVGMELVLQGRRMMLNWPLCQAPFPENILAVAAAATLLGVGEETIRLGLSVPAAVQGRFQMYSHGCWVLIDDTYNANPVSMSAALTRARQVAGDKPLICVLGDMLELGREARAAHRTLGKSLAEQGCSAVFFQGLHAGDILEGLRSTAWSGKFTAFASSSEFIAQWRKVAKGGGIVLFKGSRSCGMETHFEALRAEMEP